MAKFRIFISLVLLILIYSGCNDAGNYGINQKQPIAAGEEIFHAEFDPLMQNDVHMFIDHSYIYERIEEGSIKIKYVYTKQYMGKTDAEDEAIVLSLDKEREAILEIKPVYPSESKGRKLILKVVDEQNRITAKPVPFRSGS